METELKIGQLWWDKNHVWCYGSDTIDVCYLILSGENPYPGQTDDKALDKWFWKTLFMWCGDGYCGAQIREFTEDEIKLMELVGSIEDIKKF